MASDDDIVPLSGVIENVFGTERLRTGRLASVHYAAIVTVSHVFIVTLTQQ